MELPFNEILHKVNKINVYRYTSGELIKMLKLTHQRTCRFLDKIIDETYTGYEKK